MTRSSAIPAFCAHCVEERGDLQRCVRRGRTVWLCPDCIGPIGALRIHDVRDREASQMGPGVVANDGNRRSTPGRRR